MPISPIERLRLHWKRIRAAGVHGIEATCCCMQLKLADPNCNQQTDPNSLPCWCDGPHVQYSRLEMSMLMTKAHSVSTCHPVSDRIYDTVSTPCARKGQRTPCQISCSSLAPSTTLIMCRLEPFTECHQDPFSMVALTQSYTKAVCCIICCCRLLAHQRRIWQLGAKQ